MKDLEGRSIGLIEAFCGNFLYQLREIVKKNSVTVASVLDKIPAEYLQNTSRKPYNHANARVKT